MVGGEEQGRAVDGLAGRVQEFTGGICASPVQPVTPAFEDAVPSVPGGDRACPRTRPRTLFSREDRELLQPPQWFP